MRTHGMKTGNSLACNLVRTQSTSLSRMGSIKNLPSRPFCRCHKSNGLSYVNPQFETLEFQPFRLLRAQFTSLLRRESIKKFNLSAIVYGLSRVALEMKRVAATGSL